MKLDKKKIVFGIVIGLVSIFMVVYSMVFLTDGDDNGKQLADSIMLIENGCDVSAGLIKFKGTFFAETCLVQGWALNTFKKSVYMFICSEHVQK